MFLWFVFLQRATCSNEKSERKRNHQTIITIIAMIDAAGIITPLLLWSIQLVSSRCLVHPFYSFWMRNGGKDADVRIFCCFGLVPIPIRSALMLPLFCSILLHWYSHTEPAAATTLTVGPGHNNIGIIFANSRSKLEEQRQTQRSITLKQNPRV